MLGAMYWLGFFTIVCAIILAFMTYHNVKQATLEYLEK